jgi:hypothetical protein
LQNRKERKKQREANKRATIKNANSTESTE